MLIVYGTMHVMLTRCTQHDIARLDHDPHALMLDESASGQPDDHLTLVMAVRRRLRPCRDLHHPNVQLIVGGRALNPGQIESRRTRGVHTVSIGQLAMCDVPHHRGQGYGTSAPA